MVHIEWGNIDRTEAIEQFVQDRSIKLFTMAPDATKLVVSFQITNPQHSNGVATQKVNLELRLPNKQDLRSQHEGDNLYSSIREAKASLITQLGKRKKNVDRTRVSDQLKEGNEPPSTTD